MQTYQQQAASSGGWRDELLSWGGWSKVGNQYRKEWSMLYRDVIAGFLISGFVIVLLLQGGEHAFPPGRRVARHR